MCESTTLLPPPNKTFQQGWLMVDEARRENFSYRWQVSPTGVIVGTQVGYGNTDPATRMASQHTTSFPVEGQIRLVESAPCDAGDDDGADDKLDATGEGGDVSKQKQKAAADPPKSGTIEWICHCGPVGTPEYDETVWCSGCISLAADGSMSIAQGSYIHEQSGRKIGDFTGKCFVSLEQ